MILRRVNKHNVEHYIDLGDQFQVATKLHSKEFFDESAKGAFGDAKIPEEVFAMIVPRYEDDVPVWAEDTNSIMSTDGKFFKRLSANG